MGNACHRMLMEDSDIPASGGTTSWSGRRRLSLKERFLPRSLSGRGTRSVQRRSSFGAEAYDDAIPKSSNASLQTVRPAFAAADSFNSPRVFPRASHLIIPREDLNKEADDFIARMRGQMKMERKESDMEYLQRIERGAM